MRLLCTHLRDSKTQKDKEGRNCLCTELCCFLFAVIKMVVEGGQSLLRAQEEASLADNPMRGVRGSFSGTELEIFGFAGPRYVCSMTEGWLFCTSALLQVSGL